MKRIGADALGPPDKEAIIPRTADWKNALAASLRDPAELITRLQLPPELTPAAEAAAREFPLRVPPAFLAGIEPGRSDDPLLRQILPVAQELLPVAGFDTDPVGDRDAAAEPGVLHKYRGRVLLTVTGACAIHCRYCFRRHFPYAEENPRRDAWEPAFRYIAADTSIEEVVLSGGDPLAMDDSALAELTHRLAMIPHLRRLRIHSRVPIVLPERVGSELLRWITGTRLVPVVVVHANHPAELGDSAIGALQRLRGAGIQLLNQSVLLRGVNDEVEVLARLSERLFDAGTLPYYLHLLDRVAGAAHFEVDEVSASQLLAELRARLPGYLVPRLVREQRGAPCKLPIP